MKTLFSALSILILGFSLAGCPKTGTMQAGQPVNAFENNAYRALLDTQAAINTAKEEIAKGSLPASLTGNLNRAIAVQNVSVQLLRNYDAAVRAGNDGSAIANELTGDIAQVVMLVATLKANPPPAMPGAAPPGIQ